MTKTTYTVKANRTPQDILDSNDITLGSGLTLDDAWRVSISIQKTGAYAAVWIEEETKPEPRVTRSIEQDNRGNRYTVVRCDNWKI